jgi:hypothetical protein
MSGVSAQAPRSEAGPRHSGPADQGVCAPSSVAARRSAAGQVRGTKCRNAARIPVVRVIGGAYGAATAHPVLQCVQHPLGGSERVTSISVGDAATGNVAITAWRSAARAARNSGKHTACDSVMHTAAGMRVYRIFYRMRPVYRAGCGFASHGSLNPEGAGA